MEFEIDRINEDNERAEKLSEVIERDSRRYGGAFTEEERVTQRWS